MAPSILADEAGLPNTSAKPSVYKELRQNPYLLGLSTVGSRNDGAM